MENPPVSYETGGIFDLELSGTVITVPQYQPPAANVIVMKDEERLRNCFKLKETKVI